MPSGTTVSLDKRRTIICDAYRALDEAVKQKYEAEAKRLRAEAGKTKVLEGEDRVA